MYDWLTFYSQVFDEGAVNMWQEHFMSLDNEYTLLYCVFRASVVITFIQYYKVENCLWTCLYLPSECVFNNLIDSVVCLFQPLAEGYGTYVSIHPLLGKH